VNKELLNYYVKKSGKTIADMCAILGISRSAYYRKCNGISEFTLSEIRVIVECLELESPIEIFFAQ
jgi:ACT domain-containing protein